MASGRNSWAQAKVNKNRANRHLETMLAVRDIQERKKGEAEKKFRSRPPEEIEELRRQQRARQYGIWLWQAHRRRHGIGKDGISGNRTDAGEHDHGLSSNADHGDDGEEL